MSDVAREVAELKKEIVETRNQAIKTDNQVKNLVIDIKGFERRFDLLDSRVRLSSIGVNLLVAAAVGVAGYAVNAASSRSYRSEIAKLKQEQGAAVEALESEKAEITRQYETAQAADRAHRKAADLVATMLEHLDARREDEAVKLMEHADLSPLTQLEARLSGKRLEELRSSASESAYRAGRTHYLSGRYELAVAEFQRAENLDPKGRYHAPARFLLSVSLWNLKRYADAEPILRDVMAKDSDRNAVEEAKYYLATSLAHLGQGNAPRKTEEARKLFREIQTQGGRFADASAAYLSALDGDSTLPIDLVGGRIARAAQ